MQLELCSRLSESKRAADDRGHEGQPLDRLQHRLLLLHDDADHGWIRRYCGEASWSMCAERRSWGMRACLPLSRQQGSARSCALRCISGCSSRCCTIKQKSLLRISNARAMHPESGWVLSIETSGSKCTAPFYNFWAPSCSLPSCRRFSSFLLRALSLQFRFLFGPEPDEISWLCQLEPLTVACRSSGR